MNYLKVLVLGIDKSLMPNNEKIMWIVKRPKEYGIEESENYLMCKKVVESADIVVANFSERNPSFDDGVLMQMAYSISTPIFTVGQGADNSEFWSHLETRCCVSLDDLVDHLQAYYC